jgi:hypothetical protein
MSDTYAFGCSGCDFSMYTGWNHHRGSSKCVCIDCAAIFLIKGFKSSWGVEDGEICNLYHRIEGKTRKKKKRNIRIEFNTGVQVIVETCKQEIILDSGKTVTIDALTFGIKHLACPSCQNLGSLKLSLEAGDKCPKCKVGNIKNNGRIMY